MRQPPRGGWWTTTATVADECSQPNLEGKPDKVSNLWPRSWLKTDFPCCKTSMGVPSGVRRRRTLNEHPSSSRGYAKAACTDCSTQSALPLRRQPPRGKRWATSLRSTTATWLSLQSWESHHGSRRERYPKARKPCGRMLPHGLRSRNNKSRPTKHANVRASP